MLPERAYDVVACVTQKSSVPIGVWGVKADPNDMRKQFQHYCPDVRELPEQFDFCIHWALAELDPLQTSRSQNGNVVLAGDAFHAVIPHSASGENSAIKEGAVLGECIDWASQHSRSIVDATKAYDAIRKPRVERMQKASHEGYSFLSASRKMKAMRDKILKAEMGIIDAELAKNQEERRKQTKPPADMIARFPGPHCFQWLQGYDATADARRYLAEEMR